MLLGLFKHLPGEHADEFYHDDYFGCRDRSSAFLISVLGYLALFPKLFLLPSKAGRIVRLGEWHFGKYRTNPVIE